jgi:hypothetical protein
VRAWLPGAHPRETAGKDSPIDRPCTRCADAFENDALVLEEAVEDTSGEGAMGSSSLERKIDPFEIGRVTGSGSREPLVLIATGDAASVSRWDVHGRCRRDLCWNLIGAVSDWMRIRGQAARSIGLSASFWVRLCHPSTLRMVI